MSDTRSASLTELPVLVIDCQTTGSRVSENHILELGWQPFYAGTIADDLVEPARGLLLQQPDGHLIPPVVLRLTGICEQELEQATAPAAAWRALSQTAAVLARKAGLDRCPTVIHYARFEKPFLEGLHTRCGADQPFPLEIICTHEIVRRLLPELPRKGLRAVAGYLGHSVGKLKRAADHVRATVFVWRWLVRQLAKTYGVRTHNELERWLTDTDAARFAERRYPMARSIRLALPDSPGVYRFRRSNGDLLYVGKARNLKKRVNSYFYAGRGHGEKMLEMLTQAVQVDATPTRSALEAALLESEEIKRLAPIYNTALIQDHREVVFLSADWADDAPFMDAHYRLGPVPSAGPFKTAALLGRCLTALENRTGGTPVFSLLAGLLPNSPEESCLYQGVRLFEVRYQAVLNGRNLPAALRRIGRLAWVKEREQAARADVQVSAAGTDTTDLPASRQGFAWTPETVADRLEAVLKHCGHMLRRSRWLTVLSHCTLAWPADDSQSGAMRVLAMRQGRYTICPDAKAGALPPAPVGAHLSLHRLRGMLDLPAYDRLRVLTTELRRLVSSGRSPLIRPATGAIIPPPALKRLLDWL